MTTLEHTNQNEIENQVNIEADLQTAAETGAVEGKEKRTRKRGRGWIILAGVVCVVTLGSVLGDAISKAVAHRSLAASIAVPFVSMTKDTDSYEEAMEKLLQQKQEPEEVYELPSSVHFDEEWAYQDWDGMRTYYINSQNQSNTTIIYIHGGGCVQQPSIAHWRFINRLAKDMDAEVIVPIYPLAPYHTYEETYEKITNLYTMWRPNNNSRNILFMGDSAGAGIVVGLMQRFRDQDILYPASMVLISPWVDLSMTNPEIPAIEPKDPVLAPGWLKAAGELWAGDTNVADGRVSVLNGNMYAMPETLILMGTDDILYPDGVKLADAIEAAGSPVTRVVKEGLGHVYPLWPIPEADEAMDILIDFIGPDGLRDEADSE